MCAIGICFSGAQVGCVSERYSTPAGGIEDGGVAEATAPLDAAPAGEDATSGPAGDGSPTPGEGDDSGPDAGPSVTSVFSMDTANVVRSSNIVLTKPNALPQQFMPLGNGTLGVAEWAAQGFTAQLNRTDTLPDRKSPGQVFIPGLAALTGASDFQGTVDLYAATLTESGGGMTATIFVRADAPELIIDVTGADPNSSQTAQIKLWSGRSPTAAAANGIASLAETWTDTGGSGERFGSLAAIAVGGSNVTASAVDSLTVQVSFQPNADGSFRVVIASPSWTGGDATTTVASLVGSDTTAPLASVQAGHLAWWQDYWSRIGLLKMTSSDGAADYFEALRTVYLYATAAESRGIYPGTQAGLADIFSYLEDNQPWTPGAYWFWNLRMQVAANMSSGAFDMNTPVFYLYQSNLQNMVSWTMAHMGGRQGICVPETMMFYGNGLQNCDEASSPDWNALTITSGAEIGLWIWQTYLMTGDTTFLSTNYPLMSQVAQFMLAYATQGSDGLLHTMANAHETQWAVTDPITDIVAMKAFFPAVIAAAGQLGTDASLVTQLQAALTKVPPMPRTDAATHTQLLTASSDAAGQDVFALSYQPTAQKHNSENLDLEAVWPYGLIGDNSPDIALAQRTYMNRMFVNNPDWTFDAVERRTPRPGRRSGEGSHQRLGELSDVRRRHGPLGGRDQQRHERVVHRAAGGGGPGHQRGLRAGLRRSAPHRPSLAHNLGWQWDHLHPRQLEGQR